MYVGPIYVFIFNIKAENGNWEGDVKRRGTRIK
jgi:hypothetical protein